MAATVNPNSRLRFYDLVFVDGEDGVEYEFWDFNELPEIPILKDDIRYQVKSGDRLDLLAWKHYGSTRLKWVIAMANDIELEPVELNEDMVIRIPSPSYVQHRLFQQAKF
jgi:phage tail protein X